MPKRKTHVVQIGSVSIGGNNPVAIQSMTNTPTENTAATVRQIRELIDAGSEMVRVTINDEKAARSAIQIIAALRKKRIETPVIGDFHFNGDALLTKYPELAKNLDKYRINPGNARDKHFDAFIRLAVRHKKPVRIGVNAGSLDQTLLKKLTDQNAKRTRPENIKSVWQKALVHSALQSAKTAEKIGLKPNQIVISIKTSTLKDLVAVNEILAAKCRYPLHLGLTEAGSGLQGVASSSAALGILLNKGIGDTIRVSLTPQPGVKRAKEVEVCKAVLQSLDFRYFEPKVISCPGCGRTQNKGFERLTDKVKKHIRKNMPAWRKKYPGTEKLHIAVMGCIVNGPGESRDADLGICLPGKTDKPQAYVYARGKKIKTLTGKNIHNDFIKFLNGFIADSGEKNRKKNP